MEHKVVPFHPTVTDKGGVAQAAKELEDIIKTQSDQGWKFVSLQTMTTNIKPTGCASFGNEVAKTFQLVIFEK
jgi:hypothetical protein